MAVKFKKEGDWADGAKFDTTFDATIPADNPSIAIPPGQPLDDFLGNPGGPPVGDTPMGGINPYFSNLPQGMDSGSAAFDMYSAQDAQNQMGGFSPVVQNTVANVFSNRDNNNARGGFTPVGEDIEGEYGFEDLAAQPTAQEILDDPNRTNEQKVDDLYDLYPDAAPGLILERANQAEMTSQGVADSYRNFPIDVLTTILQTMGNQGNQDALDILARSNPLPTGGADSSGGNQPGGGNQQTNENVGDDDSSTNPNIIIGGDGAGDGQTPDDDPQETFVCGVGTLREGETVTSLDLCNIPKGDPPGGGNPPGGTPPGGDPSSGTPPGNDPGGPYEPGGDGGRVTIPEVDPPEPSEPPEPPVLGGGMAFGDFQSARTTDTEADQELRRRSLNLLGTEPTQSLMSRLNQGMTPFTGQRFAGLNPDQIAANQMLRGNVNAIPGRNIFDQATAAAGALAPIQANTISGALIDPDAIQTQGRQRIQDIVAQQFAGTNLAPYTNPYNQQVVDAALNDIERQRQLQLQRNASRATLAGAYGGDRAALVDAETNRAALDAAARTAANLRAQGFDRAAQNVALDANRALTADRANQAADTQTVRDALSVASGNLQANMAQQRAADTDTQLNRIRQSQALLDAFGQGSDIYRQYLGDFVGLGDRLDERAQRELDFDFGQFLLGQDFDQQQIDNILNLIARTPQNQKTTEQTDAGFEGDLAALTQIANAAQQLGPRIGGLISDPRGTLEDFLGL